MKQYPKYKDSGVEWIGEVPEHWEVKRLKYVATINPSKENSKISKDSDELVTFLPMEKVNEDGTFATDLKRSINELWNGFTYFEERDTIFAKITPCFENGKGAYLINLGSRVGFGSTEFHVLREIANTSISKYLYYITRFDLFRKSGESLMIGVAGQKRVSSTFAENFLIGIPPVLEQQSITAYLDRKTTQINNLISKKQKLIELLKEERAAIINQAVTKGLNPDAPMKDSGIEWLGEIPEHWEVKKLKWLAKVRLSNIDKKSKEGELKVELCNYVDVYYNDNITSKIEFMKATARQDQIDILSLEEGDVLITKDSESPDDIAVPTFVPSSLQGVVCGYHLAHIRPYRKYTNGNYLFRSFSGYGISDQFEISANGVTRFGIGKQAIDNSVFLSPPLKEQAAIAAYLDQKTTKIDQTISKIQKQIDLLKEFRTALISEVVTGKIDVRDEGSK